MLTCRCTKTVNLWEPGKCFQFHSCRVWEFYPTETDIFQQRHFSGALNSIFSVVSFELNILLSQRTAKNGLEQVQGSSISFQTKHASE